MKWAIVFFVSLMVIGYGWTVFAEKALGVEWTSSHMIRNFFYHRSAVGLWLLGWLCCRLINACFPEIDWWKIDMLVMGGIFVGHLFW